MPGRPPKDSERGWLSRYLALRALQRLPSQERPCHLSAAAASTDPAAHAEIRVRAAGELRQAATAAVARVHLRMRRKGPDLPAAGPGRGTVHLRLDGPEGAHCDRSTVLQSEIELPERVRVERSPLAGKGEMKLILIEPGGEEDRGKTLVLNRKADEVVVPCDPPVASAGFTLDLENGSRLQQVGSVPAVRLGTRRFLGESGAGGKGCHQAHPQDNLLHRSPLPLKPQ